MHPRIKVADLPEFDATPYFDNEVAVAAYLTDILEANDPALLASALRDIAQARGMSEIAKASGLTREALYKALRPNAKPRYDIRCDLLVLVQLGILRAQGKGRNTRYVLNTAP